ncbi:MAG TPA: deaminase domain-containing protein [Nostocaceae cyanobacterium]|nr:deaminase domain-containing protein [Nostocaceae cyanobacterium]
MTNRQDNFDKNSIKDRLRECATQIRNKYIGKPILNQPFFNNFRSNVAVAEIYLKNNVVFSVGGTAGKNSPIPQPKSKSEGGQFEPGVDLYSKRLMDTDAEYKVLSAIADTLEMNYDLQVEGYIYLYTEREPCESCQEVIKQFQQKFPNINIEENIFWDHPYPPLNLSKR